MDPDIVVRIDAKLDHEAPAVSKVIFLLPK